MTAIHKRVSFQGEVYWLHGNEGDTDLLLSPLNHFDDEGELLADVFDVSYAIVRDGRILRYCDQIGTQADLIDVIDSHDDSHDQ